MSGLKRRRLETMESMNLKVLLLATLWLMAAICFGGSGLLARAPMPMPQIVLLALTAALMAGFWKSPPLRAWVEAIQVQALVWFHAIRFVGLYFLFLYARGELPREFAVPCGLGDIVVASSAVVVASTPATSKMLRWLYLAWNATGLLDIVFVVATAARLGWSNPASMSPLTRLPLSLLPTFLVPIIIATHLVLFLRLQDWSRTAEV